MQYHKSIIELKLIW